MKVAVIMGSKSDFGKVEPGITILKKFKVDARISTLTL